MNHITRRRTAHNLSISTATVHSIAVGRFQNKRCMEVHSGTDIKTDNHPDISVPMQAGTEI